MVTIVDPSGSPAIAYNRSGATLETIEANGTTLGSATPIPALTGYTIVVASSTTGNDAIALPEDAEVGDAVELHTTGLIRVFAPSGENLSDNASVLFGGNVTILFRKISATTWRYLGQPA